MVSARPRESGDPAIPAYAGMSGEIVVALAG
jgi:hypothetical protein